MKWEEIFTKINFITFLWEDPCDAPWTVYAETAGPALMELFVSLYGLDLFDLQKEKYQRSLNPYRLRSNRKGNTGNKRNRRTWRGRLGALVSFDPNEASGRRLSPVKKPPQIRFSVGRASLFLVGGILERLVWQWFLLSQLFEFFFNWSSALLKSEACSEKAAAVCMREGGGQTIIGVGPYYDLIFGDVIKQRGNIISTGLTIHPQSGQRWIAMGNFSFFVIPPDTGVTIKFRIFDQANGGMLSEGKIEDARWGIPYEGTLNASGVGAASLSVQVDVEGGFILTEHQTFYVMSKPLAS